MNDPDDIAEKVNWILDNPDKAKEIGKAGKEMMMTLQWEKSIDKIENVYKEVMR